MPILRPSIIPTVGVPQAVVASRRPRNMSQREFYLSSMRGNQQQANQPQQGPVYQSPQQTNDRPQEQQFENDPVTGDYLAQQLERYNQRAAPPMLEPGGRVKSANSELVQPSSFQVFYQQLQQINDIGQQQVGAESARSAFRAMQAMQAAQANSYKGGSSTGSRQTGGGQAYGNGVPSNPAANFRFAQQIGPQFGWTGKELSAWYTLGMKESGWRNTAQNPTSTAYGIGQFLNSTWAGVGMTKTSDPQQQVLAMAKYIKNRYGSPSRALAFHYANNWY